MLGDKANDIISSSFHSCELPIDASVRPVPYYQYNITEKCTEKKSHNNVLVTHMNTNYVFYVSEINNLSFSLFFTSHFVNDKICTVIIIIYVIKSIICDAVLEPSDC